MATVNAITTDSGHVFQVVQYNETQQGDGFYISFNDHDVSLHGDITTAFVIGNMEGFLVLKGDHRKAYSELIPLGFDACLDYFMANVDQASKTSEHRFLQGRKVVLPLNKKASNS
ncbi:hypothetical protein ACI2KR_31100 [Pseudomonas luteola]